MRRRPLSRRVLRAGVFVGVTLVSMHCPAALERVGFAQQIQFGDRAGEPRKSHVLLLTEAVNIRAGAAQDVELQFRVEPGYHINSHTPKDQLLLPTVLKLEPAEGVTLAGEEYPAGTPFRLEMGAGEALDVYQNEFRVRVRLTAPRGHTKLEGALHYQACDSSACFPPRTLPVKVLIAAK